MKIRSFESGFENVEMLKKAGRYDLAKQLLNAMERLLPKEKYAEKRRKRGRK